MIIVALTPKFESDPLSKSGVFTKHGLELVKADQFYSRQGSRMDGLCGLYVTGDAATATPSMKSAWQEDDLSFLKSALEMDVPVLATGLGLGLLNQAFGGKPIAPVSGHGAGHGESNGAIVTHTIYLSPGSKSAAILGVGGFFKVTSRHMEGLREPQRSPRLLASAYAVEDGVIEGLESVEHRWVIGFQATIEREGEAPRVFGNVVQAFVERARAFAAGETSGGRL